MAVVVACGGSGNDRTVVGAVLFMENCAICHGKDARGGGGGGVAGLSKTPPDLTRLAVENGDRFPVYETLETLEGYANGGLRGRQMVFFDDLNSERKARVRLETGRVRTSRPLGALLKYLEAVQRP